MSLLVVVLGTIGASGRYSGADLRLRKGDAEIDSNRRQVYVNVKVKKTLCFPYFKNKKVPPCITPP
ncbi:hypothetical protein D3C79_1079890 [compost metagenome]